MIQSEDSKKAFETISEDRLVTLAREIIRMPSKLFEEHEVADYLADYMTDMGFDVEMMEVIHPWDETLKTRQPIATLKGAGGGSSLMFNGHMDTNVTMPGWTVDPYEGKLEDGWLWGLGAQDDKGGMAAAISGIEGLIKAGINLKGDIVMCPVAAHKVGGTGTRTLCVRALAPITASISNTRQTPSGPCVRDRCGLRSPRRRRGSSFVLRPRREASTPTPSSSRPSSSAASDPALPTNSPTTGLATRPIPNSAIFP